MKLYLLVAIVGLASVQAEVTITAEQLSASFQQFKRDFARNYGNQAEEMRRQAIFGANLALIYEHNNQVATGSERTYTLGVNQFADLTNEEYREKFLNLPKVPRSANRTFLAQLGALPDSIDWVSKGKVVPIKDQGQCGSAVAFASVATIESAHAIATNQLVSLSEQQVSDCCDPSSSCNGSPMSDDDVFKCIIQMKGIDTEGSYPDWKIWDQCKFNPKTIGAEISSYVDVQKGSEDALKAAVATAGPVASEIDASHISFQLYAGGVYNEPACLSNMINHAVAVVGYGATTDGTQFWKVKNSWGAAWGENGYMRMSKNKNNQCGIASIASYPVV